MSETIQNVGLVGLGVVSFDIVCLYALKGCRTFVYDAAQAAMESLTDGCEQSIDRLQKQNRIFESEIDNSHRFQTVAQSRRPAVTRSRIAHGNDPTK